MWKEIMTRKRRPVSQPDPMNDFRGFRWVECYVDTAVNPVTKHEVTLTPPVRIGCYEDFAKFYDEFEDFCRNVLPPLNPDEVHFTLK